MDKATCQRIHQATVWVFDPETNQEEPQLDKELYARLVQDRKTGEWYNPQEAFDNLMNKPEIMASLKRLSIR